MCTYNAAQAIMSIGILPLPTKKIKNDISHSRGPLPTAPSECPRKLVFVLLVERTTVRTQDLRCDVPVDAQNTYARTTGLEGLITYQSEPAI